MTPVTGTGRCSSDLEAVVLNCAGAFPPVRNPGGVAKVKNLFVGQDVAQRLDNR